MKTRFILASFAVVISSLAHAQSLGLAGQFNAFIFGNANTAGGHSDGAVAVGLNWTGSGYDVLQHNHPATVGGDNKVGMYVGGSVNYSNGGSINNAGNARVKGNFHTQNYYNVNGGGLFVGGTRTGMGASATIADTVNLSVFSSQQTFSNNQTLALAGLGGTAIDTTDLNNWSVNTALQAGNAKRYTISSSDLNKIRTLAINGLTANDTVVINVIGSAVNGFGITVNTNTGQYNRILWNFGGSTFKVSDRALHGSLLAPYATVDQYQNIDGTLIAANWNNYNSQELHHVPFVPEPGTLSVLGLGLFPLLRRRRK